MSRQTKSNAALHAPRFYIPALIALAALAGCATLTDSNQQSLVVRTVQDNQEVAGVGCVLQNKAGRWFVTAPGRITITRSAGDLTVDCKKDAESAGYDVVASKVNQSGLWGNLVISAGLGYLVDKQTGAGFDYPETLTVILRSSAKPAQDARDVPSGTPIH